VGREGTGSEGQRVSEPRAADPGAFPEGDDPDVKEEGGEGEGEGEGEEEESLCSVCLMPMGNSKGGLAPPGPWQSTRWPSPLVAALNKIGQVYPASHEDGGNVFQSERCGHQVHVECLMQYLGHGHARCPLCRAEWDVPDAAHTVARDHGPRRVGRGWDRTAPCAGASLSAALVALAPLMFFAWAYLVLELLKRSGVVVKDDFDALTPTHSDFHGATLTM